MGYIYITLEQAIEIHKKTVAVSGGGSLEQLEIGKLDSVLTHIQNDEYYPTFLEKVTHLFYCANKFHCFLDGNKRIAITLAAHFLLLNGYMYCSSRFIREMENISYHVAAGRIDKSLLHDIIGAVLDETIDSDEELKLRLLQAIQDPL
ncbi:MAG TPA: type II toxin-antitoxin system death-on-curing family toxin [Treponema sp.]|nr:type II toxin-antitoxin system death-on-curing family toxin [Treponema sp.]HRS04507.1 type II toxin-antitoxin system death-on-curing family toxin [Treponema sp.]HRU29113.1 type II toxin-antitoxin system death-on-curing family toxin [Treponema sp.]